MRVQCVCYTYLLAHDHSDAVVRFRNGFYLRVERKKANNMVALFSGGAFQPVWHNLLSRRFKKCVCVRARSCAWLQLTFFSLLLLLLTTFAFFSVSFRFRCRLVLFVEKNPIWFRIMLFGRSISVSFTRSVAGFLSAVALDTCYSVNDEYDVDYCCWGYAPSDTQYGVIERFS